jgi:antitoxin component of MazEF toxin-antitoxin module
MGSSVSIDPERSTVSAERRIRQSGNSNVLTIPRQMLESVGFERGDDIELEADMDSKEIVLRKV